MALLLVQFDFLRIPVNVVSIGASVWIYASLDAIDGKHARRTGQCGPLGELFDHGCDALNMAVHSDLPSLLKIL